MDNYIVSALKYRPSTFLSVVGQKALVQTLKAAIVTSKLAHAYLFCGTRGVGKTTCARIFAKTINCEHPTPEGEACNECESCRAFNEQRSYNIIELDAASNNTVDDIRDLIEKVRIPPQIGHYKVFIIDEVHMLSLSAFNAFLKTLEEPPRHAIFILATTEKHKLLPTILSRCQIYDFQRISVEDIAEHLHQIVTREGMEAEDEALNIIARKADGGMRDALSIFDQIAASTNGKITYQATIDNLNILDYDYYFRLVDTLLTGDVPGALLIFDAVLRAGFSAQLFVNGLSSHFRDLMMCQAPETLPLLDVGATVAEQYARQAEQCSKTFLYKAMELSNRCDLDYRISNNKRLLVELTLIKICGLCHPTEEIPSKTKMPSTPSVSHQPTTAQGSKADTQKVESSNPQSTSSTNKGEVQPVSSVPTEKPATTEAAKSPASTATGSHILTSPTESATFKAHTRKIPHISLKQEIEGTDNQSTIEETNSIEENEPFTLEALHMSWLRFTKKIPTETVLVQTMYSCSPQLLNPDTFEVVVDNRVQLDKLSERKADLMAFLRSELHNTRIEMQVRERERGERQKAFSPSERFASLSEKNPGLNQLKERFGLDFL